MPRVTHEGCLCSADLYRGVLQPGARVLDLCSSWDSHLPEEVQLQEVSKADVLAASILNHYPSTRALTLSLIHEAYRSFQTLQLSLTVGETHACAFRPSLPQKARTGQHGV